MSDEDDELKAYLEHAKDEMFPKLKRSALNVTILGEPDPKLCLELGAAILFDKPIIVLVPSDRPVPANLRRVAAEVVQGGMNDPTTDQRLRDAIARVLKNDVRTRQ